MVISEENVNLLKKIFTQHGYPNVEQAVDETPGEALTCLLAEVEKVLSSRQRRSAPLDHVTNSAVGTFVLECNKRRKSEKKV